MIPDVRASGPAQVITIESEARVDPESFDVVKSSGVTAEELEAVDASLDAMMLEESGTALNVVTALLSIEEAREKISPEILEVLNNKFKGSLTQTRHLDERDQIF